MVRRPPMRSATTPQICRLTKAQPSSTESIAAPCDAGIPTSLQKATRWPCGIAIGTQQKKPAAASIESTVRGRSPSTRAPGRGPLASPSTPRVSGAGPSLLAFPLDGAEIPPEALEGRGDWRALPLAIRREGFAVDA